jgi:ubiquinone/menaquinone biosynthesis C-methylase UbiE
MSEAQRPWERWDDPGIAIHIDRWWRQQPSEAVHRRLLAAYVTTRCRAGSRILEVGCGSGYFYEHLVAAMPDVDYCGVDTSEQMLRLACQKYPQGRFTKGDIYGLPFPTQSFDHVLAFEVLGHLPEIVGPLRELMRVCSRSILFTLWDGQISRDIGEQILTAAFVHREYAKEDVIHAVQTATAPGSIVYSTVISRNIHAHEVFTVLEHPTSEADVEAPPV